MTDNNHPITPPPELVKQWVSLACEYEGNETWIDLATQAARWGADQELEACCEWVSQWRCMVGGNRPEVGLRAARRPEPEPEGPTDEEIMELMPQQMRDDLAAAARALAGFDPDNIKAASVFRIILNRHFVDHSRVVLARWGNHPASPDSSTQPS